MRTEINLNESELDLNECEHFLKVNLDRSEIDLNECEHFLKVNLDRSEIDLSWINVSSNGRGPMEISLGE